jgi:hypothetical protein
MVMKAVTHTQRAPQAQKRAAVAPCAPAWRNAQEDRTNHIITPVGFYPKGDMT